MTELIDAVDAVQLVSVTFLDESGNRLKTNSIVSLFDTGSPTSFISSSVVPSQLHSNRLIYSNYNSMANTKLFTYGKIDLIIEIFGIINKLSFLILPENLMPFPLLIGRNYLPKFGIHLIKSISNQNNKLCSDKIKKKIPEKLFTALYKNSFCCKPDSLKNSSDLVISDCKSAITIDNHNFGNCFVESPTFELSNKNKTDDHFVESPTFELIDKNEIENCYLGSELPYFDSLICSTIGEELNIDPKLELRFKSGLLNIIEANYFNNPLIGTKRVDCRLRIRVTSDSPISFGPRRLSYAEKIGVQQIIDDLLNKNIIRPSCSPYAAPIVLVKKRSGEMRMCVDYRALNAITVRDNYPLPLIDDCIEYLSNKKYFSVLDLKSGFHQVDVSSDSVKYTSFVVPGGQYEYLKMPFGLKNAPSVFQRFVSEILQSLIVSRKIVVYMDDILLATETVDEHFGLMAQLLSIIAEHGLELQLRKCQFVFTRIEYLGYAIDSNGIRPGERHLDAIHKYPTPGNVREVQSFLGLASYFRRFIHSFAIIASPLTNLTKKECSFKLMRIVLLLLKHYIL